MMNNNTLKCCSATVAKEKDIYLFNKDTETNRMSVDSFEMSTTIPPNLKKRDLKSKGSEEWANLAIDHSLPGLLNYQKEIEQKCDYECPTRKNFTVAIVNNYYGVKTSNKVDLASVIYLKVVYPNAPCPYAIDADCYNVFKDLFHPVISDLQNGAPMIDSCQGLNFGNAEIYEDLDLNADKEVLLVMYSEIIVRRNLNDFNLSGSLKVDQRLVVKDILKSKCLELFSSLSPVTIPNEWAVRIKSIESYLYEAGAMDNYPKGRLNMVYKDELDCSIGSIINYDDHLQIVLSTNNGKVGHIFNQTNKIFNSTIMCKSEFMKHQKYGYVTFSPQFLGTGFTIRLFIRLKFICLMDDVEDIYLKDLSLSLKTFDDPNKGLMILSNSRTLGITEMDIFQNILEGYRRLFDLDHELRNTSPNAIIDKTMPVESMTTLVNRIHSCETVRTYTKKYLTDTISHQYENVPTKFNGLFNHCIRANAFYPKSLFPKACDPDCYSIFSRFFNPVILEVNHCRQFLHNASPNYDKTHSEPRYRLQHNLIKGYRVRFSRNILDYPFPMLMTNEERKEIKSKLVSAFQQFPKDIAGTYYDLENISEAKEFNYLKDLCLIPSANNHVKRASWVYRDWPQDRGIFVSLNNPSYPDNILIILVNEADHFQVSCINTLGIRLDRCYDRAVLAMRFLDNYFNNSYSKKPNYGFLSSNPQNVGCCMRVSAMIYLRFLGEDRQVLNKFCILNNLNYRGQFGSGTQIKNNIYDISLKLNLNYSENQILMLFTQRIKDLILEERTYDHTISNSFCPKNDTDNNPVFSKMLTDPNNTTSYPTKTSSTSKNEKDVETISQTMSVTETQLDSLTKSTTEISRPPDTDTDSDSSNNSKVMKLKSNIAIPLKKL